MTDDDSSSAKQTHTPVRFALLMPWGRVGSHLVLSALNAIPDIRILNEPTTSMRTRGHASGLSPKTIGQQQLDHLDAFTKGLEDEGRIGGLKLSFRSLVHKRAYLRRLAAQDYRLVLLVRENFLKCAVSQLRALERAAMLKDGNREWASPWAVKSEEPKPGPTSIDVDEAVRVADVFKTFHDMMLKDVGAVFGSGYSTVEYDDLKHTPSQKMHQVFDYLGLAAPENIPIDHRKATSDDLREDILNYDAFSKGVIAAGLGHFL